MNKRMKPSILLDRPTFLTGFKHPTACVPKIVTKNASMSMLTGALGSGLLNGVAEGVSLLCGAGTFWVVPSFLVGTLGFGGLTFLRAMQVSADEQIQKAMSTHRSSSESMMNAVSHAILHPHRSDGSEDCRTDDELKDARRVANSLMTDYRSISNDQDASLEELRDVMSLRLSSIHDAFKESQARMGSAPMDEVMSIMAESVQLVISEAMRKRETILGYSRSSSSGEPTITDRFRDDVTQAMRIGASTDPKATDRTGTGHARIDRLISKAEEALSIDPDMVDAAGARLDSALREHLPRLLRTHAESARLARVEDLEETDRQLETGIEQIRSSLEEGLQSLRNDRADALLTEVAFLKLRRAGIDGQLHAIEDLRSA